MKKSDKAWSKSWMPCSTDSSTLNTRPPPPKNSGNRQGRNILTAVECRRATAGLLLLGSYDRRVPRSCGWQTRQSIGCHRPHAAPVPIEKSADWEMDGKEDFKIFSAKWEGEMSKTTLRVNNRPRRFLRFGYRVQTTKSAEASAEAAYPLGEPTVLCSRRMKVS